MLYGSSTGICGLQLCSEISGGKAAWKAGQTPVAPVAPVEEPMGETHEEKHMDESMEETEADLGSVLRLSRTNVPAKNKCSSNNSYASRIL